MITSKGIVIRWPVAGVRVQGRTTQGVRLIRLDEGDRVTDVARIVTEGEPGAKTPELAVVTGGALAEGEALAEPEDADIEEDEEGDDEE